MRILSFSVKGQRLTKDKECNFSDIVAGSENYLKAKFWVSPEWYGCKKAASFWVGDQEYAVMLDEDSECFIPKEVLSEEMFKVSLTGVMGDYKITTGKTKVKQEVY